jgi:hypothetical protein
MCNPTFVVNAYSREIALPHRMAWMTEGGPYMQTWEQWQSEIVTLLQKDFDGEALQHICHEDIDWPSWHGFFLQGKSPRAAIERALERDL